jgi:Xaa-Pro dipeptidase
LTGCPTLYRNESIQHHLFVPRADPLETMWSVAPPTLEDSRNRFDSDSIEYGDSIQEVFRKANRDGFTLLTLPNTLEFPAIPDLNGDVDRNDKILLEAIHEARLTKDDHEIELIREANRISSAAHEVLMRELGRFAQKRRQFSRTGKETLQQWEVESEGDAEALFVATCRRAG